VKITNKDNSKTFICSVGSDVMHTLFGKSKTNKKEK
jgi:hypothetical protein